MEQKKNHRIVGAEAWDVAVLEGFSINRVIDRILVKWGFPVYMGNYPKSSKSWISMTFWLVVWNMNFMTFQYFPYIGNNHPN